MNHKFLPIAYHLGEFKPFTDANISIATQALNYGTAAFGGLRATINPKNKNQVILFRLDKHTKRLSQSAKYLNWNLEPTQIERLIIEFIKQNKPNKDIYIRPLIYVSDLGIAPKIDTSQKDFAIYGLEFGDYLGSEVSCCFSSWVRQVDSSLPLRGKMSGAYMTSALAKSEAIERGFDEAILMNNQGKVSEGSAMNIFIVRDGKLITPSVDQDILEGITRDSVIQIAKDGGIEVEIRPVDKTELIIADEVFLTGTAAKITSLKKIENYELAIDKPVASMLKDKLNKIILGQDLDYTDWISRVELE